MKSNFIKAIENRNLEQLRKIDKSDLHNHSSRGGNANYLEASIGREIPRNTSTFKSLHDMQEWINRNINPLFKGTSAYEKLIEAAFVQAKSDGVKVLNMSISSDALIYYRYSIEGMINAIKRIHHTFAPDINFIPEIGFKTSRPVDVVYQLLENILEYRYFKSVDVYGSEVNMPTFKKVYRKAKESGLILKAHVGEFGSAELVRRCVEELELNQVQHGISSADSKDVMNFLRNNSVQLNICPTSNIILSRVKNYKVHPIRKLYDNGVKVTINTDDMLIFNQSVSDEYLNLFNEGVFNAKELDEIRKTGLEIAFDI